MKEKIKKRENWGRGQQLFLLSSPQSGPCRNAEPSPAEWSSEYQSHCPSLEGREEGRVGKGVKERRESNNRCDYQNRQYTRPAEHMECRHIVKQ